MPLPNTTPLAAYINELRDLICNPVVLGAMPTREEIEARRDFERRRDALYASIEFEAAKVQGLINATYESYEAGELTDRQVANFVGFLAGKRTELYSGKVAA